MNRSFPPTGLARAYLALGFACLAAFSARAADVGEQVTGAPTFVRWSGWFLGLSTGAGGSFGKSTLRTAAGGPVAFTSGFAADDRATPILLGIHGGYNWQFGRVVLGAEADVAGSTLRRTVPRQGVGGGEADDRDTMGQATAPSTPLATGPGTSVRTRLETVGSLRARLGWAFGTNLVYATAGPAWARARVTDPVGFVTGDGAVAGRTERSFLGYTVGAGIELAVSPDLSLGFAYRFSDLGRSPYLLGPAAGAFSAAGARFDRETTHDVLARLTWHPSGLRGASWDEAGRTGPLGLPFDTQELANWSIHGQNTFITQAVPGFRSPYIGQQSFVPRQARETLTSTAYVGRRLWEDAEFYFNPEFIQGFGLSNSNGIAGFVNGEATKAGYVAPRFKPQRYFVRQTFGLGGEQETVEDGPNQIAGTRDVDRVTLTVGKFAINDIFDDNVYAHDPRLQFLNLSMWESAAYDFPANLAGYTQGAVVELNRKDWAVRAGYFQVPKAPNSDVLNPRVLSNGGVVAEAELRFVTNDQPGKLRLGAFNNRGRTGNFREALALCGPDACPDIAATRRSRSKAGVYANVEQAVTSDIGLFARLSWNDGRNEILSLTDVDRSASGGVAIKGTSWNRPGDVIGVGGAANGLTKSHRDFLAAGGLGLLIGDGRLRYSPERILETYYALSVLKTVRISFDYQFVANPGYNASRGPASVFGLRVHAEY